MPYQTGVVEALRDHGLTVGFCPGWETRGSSSFDPRGHVVHHDAGNNWTTPPGILIAGRSDLPGPLCNFALGRDGKVWMVAAGRANHAGTGSWRGLVGNSSVWGTEANNRGTGEMWPDVQIDAYARLCAATCEFSGFSAEMVCRHAEWTTRKIDPAGPWEDGHDWSRDASHFRALVAQGGTDMPLNDADLFTIGVIVKKALADVGLATLSEQEKRRAAKTRERLARIEAELAEDD